MMWMDHQILIIQIGDSIRKHKFYVFTPVLYQPFVFNRSLRPDSSLYVTSQKKNAIEF